MSEYNFYAMSAAFQVNGTEDIQVGYLLPVVVAFRDGTMTYDADARKGKGGFKGGSKVEQLVADQTTSVLPTEFRGVISKAATVIRDMGAELLTVADDELVDAVRAFIQAHGSISALYSKLDNKVKASRTIAAIVASMFAETNKNEYSVSDVVAEVLAQAEAAAE